MIVDHHKFRKKRPQNVIHQPHKCARSIREAEWNHHPVINPSFGLKCRFSLITFPYTDLVISPPSINFGEDGGVMVLIKHVIKHRYRVHILASNVIDGATIHTHAKSSIFLGN